MSGAVVWFTGLPASGKSTLADGVRAALGPRTIALDSDELRDALGATGYGAHDRDAFYRALANLAAVLARQGFVVLVAATAPRRAHRNLARELAPAFVEVYLRTPLAVCEARDPKQLYVRARTGEAPALPGVGVPYEVPEHPDVVAEHGRDARALAAVVSTLARVRTRSACVAG